MKIIKWIFIVLLSFIVVLFIVYYGVVYDLSRPKISDQKIFSLEKNRYRIMAINIDKTNNKGNISVYFKGLQNKSAGEIVDFLIEFDKNAKIDSLDSINYKLENPINEIISNMKEYEIELYKKNLLYTYEAKYIKVLKVRKKKRGQICIRKFWGNWEFELDTCVIFHHLE